jgi:hypothetical protein
VRGIVPVDHPVTVHQVFYRVVSKGLANKTECDYKSTLDGRRTEMRQVVDLPFGGHRSHQLDAQAGNVFVPSQHARVHGEDPQPVSLKKHVAKVQALIRCRRLRSSSGRAARLRDTDGADASNRENATAGEI